MAASGLNYMVTGDDLERFGLPARTYSELSLDRPLETCALLYEVVPGRGHWVLLDVDEDASPPTIEFMDPYGAAPDEELGLGARLSRRQGPVLSELLNRWEDEGGQVVVSRRQLQSAGASDKTCGRWVLARWLQRDMPLEDWQDQYSGSPKSNDEIVVEQTAPLLGR